MDMHTVTVLPDGISFTCSDGSNLMEALSGKGIALEAPCGGKGFCGKCRVRIVEGRDLIETSETQRLTQNELAEGYVLACHTRVMGSIVVDIPANSRLGSQKILSSGRGREVAVKPAVSKVFVKVPDAVITDQCADSERLLRAVESAVSNGGYIDTRSMDVGLIRKIPSIIRESSAGVTAVLYGGRLIDIEAGDTAESVYGAAFDIGTTTVVGYLMDLRTGEELAVASRMNPQVIFGDDVVTRINYTIENEDGLEKLSNKVVGIINEIIYDLCRQKGVEPSSLYEIAVAGNTCMSHLLAGVNPKYLGLYPYVSAFSRSLSIPSGSLGLNINPLGKVYLMPNIASFVGGDTVGVMLSVEADRTDAPTLIIDIGTNGEIVMARDNKIWTASCAAGPAFEGGHVTCGMRGTAGAIDLVKFGDADILIRTIGDEPAKGICGSGLIDVLAELLRYGLVDSTGRFVSQDMLPQTLPAAIGNRLIKDETGTRFVLSYAHESSAGKEVFINQKDLRELQLIKAAIFAGCKILLDISGTPVDSLSALLLAGAFGNYIDKENALYIGLIPGVSSKIVTSVGNAAGMGAKIALVSQYERNRGEAMASEAVFVELANRPDFQEEYMNAMFFEQAMA